MTLNPGPDALGCNQYRLRGSREMRQPLAKCRGRDAGYPTPPAQIPASGITAQGSYLGCLTSNR